MNRSGVVACLDKDAMICFDEILMAYLEEGVVEILDKNIKNDFDVEIRTILDVCFGFYSCKYTGIASLCNLGFKMYIPQWLYAVNCLV